MLEINIICDGCGEPIAGRPGYPKNEYVSVSLKEIPMMKDEGARYLIAMKSKLDREYQFHGIKCLSEWKKIEELAN